MSEIRIMALSAMIVGFWSIFFLQVYAHEIFIQSNEMLLMAADEMKQVVTMDAA